jgi:hypothetical protein
LVFIVIFILIFHLWFVSTLVIFIINLHQPDLD